jgi:hypothetical protein
MDHVTVLCFSNISETDKQKLLVIGKMVKTQYFKGICMDSVPILYYANKNAWIAFLRNG